MKKGLDFIRFPTPESVGERDWGEEILLCLVSGKFTLKKLKINAGSQGGLQYHRLKDEVGVILTGELQVDYEDDKGQLLTKTLVSGDVFHVPPGAIHRERAVTDVEIFELSSPHFNDRVRCENLFGEDVNGGLPTTTENEIIIK